MNTREVADALEKLGIPRRQTGDICRTAAQYGHNCISIDGGVADIYFKSGKFRVTHKKNSGQTVAPRPTGHYTQPHDKDDNAQRRHKMAGRTGTRASTKAQAEAEPAQEEPEDLTVYADKEATATMVDFADWLVDEVYGGEYPGGAKAEDEFRNGVRLGGTLRMKFQASDFNKERREERRATKAVSNGAEDAEEEKAETKPTRGRGATGKTAAAGKATTGGKPTGRGRGKAAAGDAAPY